MKALKQYFPKTHEIVEAGLRLPGARLLPENPLLMYAILAQDEETVRKILLTSNKTSVNYITPCHETPILLALLTGNIRILEMLLLAGAYLPEGLLEYRLPYPDYMSGNEEDSRPHYRRYLETYPADEFNTMSDGDGRIWILVEGEPKPPEAIKRIEDFLRAFLHPNHPDLLSERKRETEELLGTFEGVKADGNLTPSTPIIMDYVGNPDLINISATFFGKREEKPASESTVATTTVSETPNPSSDPLPDSPLVLGRRDS